MNEWLIEEWVECREIGGIVQDPRAGKGRSITQD